jgi:hypothetical protein
MMPVYGSLASSLNLLVSYKMQSILLVRQGRSPGRMVMRLSQLGLL